MHLSIIRSNLVRFSNFFFLQKAYENRHLAKYWVRNCAPCAPTSAAPVIDVLQGEPQGEAEAKTSRGAV